MQFSLLDLEMNDTWQYELHPPHLISVATLPCESQNAKNVTLQWDITKENCIICIIASSKWTRVIMCLKFTYMGVIQQSVHETKIHHIDDLLKRLMQTCFEFDRNIINAGVTIWNRVHAGGGQFEHMLWHECSFIWFSSTFYETADVIWCI